MNSKCLWLLLGIATIACAQPSDQELAAKVRAAQRAYHAAEAAYNIAVEAYRTAQEEAEAAGLEMEEDPACEPSHTIGRDYERAQRCLLIYRKSLVP